MPGRNRQALSCAAGRGFAETLIIAANRVGLLNKGNLVGNISVVLASVLITRNARVKPPRCQCKGMGGLVGGAGVGLQGRGWGVWAVGLGIGGVPQKGLGPGLRGRGGGGFGFLFWFGGAKKSKNCKKKIVCESQ